MTNVPNNQNPEDPSDNDSDRTEGTAHFSSGDYGTIEPLPLPVSPSDPSPTSPSDPLPLPTSPSGSISLPTSPSDGIPLKPDSAESLPTLPSGTTPTLIKDIIDSNSETVDLSVSSVGKDPSHGDLEYEGSSDSDASNTVVYDSGSHGSGPLTSLGSGSGLGSGGVSGGSGGASGGSGRNAGSAGSGRSAGSARSAGSNERLHREWDAAIGTSGKGSGESLRFERAEASDSVLDRVVLRTVVESNVDKSEYGKVDYAIQDKLGEGGMKYVYSALQVAVNRVVALATLKQDKVNETHKQKQFFYEAEITAELDHPNIPPIYEIGLTSGGTYFYTMKRIKGSEWQRVMSKKSQEDNLEIFEKLADAIGFAHSKQILHLDIKPENVIVGAYGEVYVTDWGLAYNMSKDIPLQCGGTPDYMAPEMARKAVDSVGKQTDIYLLGATLFQIVTGKTPHPGADTKDRKKLAYSKLVDAYHNKIRAIESDDPILKVALKAMSTNPADRYATVEDLKSAVEEIVRENANIKTSLELTKSSKTTLQLAEKSQDYERFNRAIFGFQNAVEVWTGNKEAETELSRARLSFGKCAFDKRDYEVALQTLDRKVPEEAALFDKAQKAKTALLQRESRFKTLRNAVIGLIALGGVGATGAAILINAARTDAVRQKEIATAKQLEAEKAQRTAEKAQADEKEQRMIADQKTKDAIAAQDAEKEQRMIADQKTKDAIAAQDAEKEQRMIAVEKTKEALRNLAQVKVNQQLTQIGFASAQADQANPVGAFKQLADLKKKDLNADIETKDAFKDGIPHLSGNWATDRVGLLSNLDLPLQEFGGKVTAIDFAHGVSKGIAGLGDGRVVKLELQDGKLVERSSKKVGAYILATSISPTGDEAMLAIADNKNGDGAKLYRWDLEGDLEPMQENATANRYFQGLAYSPDGSKVVAGLRGGIWWRKTGDVWKDLTPNIKGILRDVDWLDDDCLLVLTENDTSKDRNLHVIRMLSDGKVETGLVETDQLLGKTTQVGVISDKSIANAKNECMLILSSEGEEGGLYTYKLNLIPKESEESTNKQLTNKRFALKDRQALPNKHRKAVTQIDISPSRRRMVTGSGEAVAYAWRIEPNSGSIEYDTFLTGAPGEQSEDSVLEKTAFIDEQRVIALDKTGSAVALDIERQKQRRELARDRYEARVVGIHPRGKTDSVISVDANGVVDLWSLVTGKTETAMRYSYFGHTPGATLFDTAIDAQKGIVVTAAVLPRSAGAIPYIGKEANVEFCVWDKASGNMVNRWSDKIPEPVEPRLTLLGDDKFFVGCDTRTVVFDYQHQASRSSADSDSKNGATFAVVNPSRPSLVALCRRSGGKGQVFLWDREVEQVPNLKKSEVQNDMPVHAAWSSDGQRLYVLDMAGKITPYILSGEELASTRNEYKAFEDPAVLNVLRSYQDVDFVARSHGDSDSVICNVRERSPYRTPGSEEKNRTITFTCNFTFNGKIASSKPEPVGEVKSGLFWLDDLPNYSVKPEPQILSKRRAGNQMFVSFRNGRIYGLSEQGGNPVLYGRQPFTMSTSDREGSRLMLLHEDGSILESEIKPEGAVWKRKEYKLETGETVFSLSPDGKELAVYNSNQKSVRVLAADSGQLLRDIKGISVFEWNPEQDHSLATLATDGSLTIEGEGKPVGDVSKEDVSKALEGLTPKKLAFFEEKLNDANQEKVLRYLLIQAENPDPNAKYGTVFFVPREPGLLAESNPAGEGEQKVNDNRIYRASQNIGSGVELTVSPRDSIVATGDSDGTIAIWFASPRYQIFNRVYDLDREQATSVARIAFSGDGDTLITSDQQRVSAWMSRDKSSPGK